MTVTVTEAVAVAPFFPVTVATYVVVCAGLTVACPSSGNAPGSPSLTEGVKVMVVALDVVQVKVLIWPALMVAGLAESCTVGAVEAVTVTVTVAVDWPPFAPVAVRVKVVVAVGDTFTVPFMGRVPVTPLMVTWFALVDQLRMAVPPVPMVEGVAVNEAMVGPLGLCCGGEAPRPLQPAIARRQIRRIAANKHLKPHFKVINRIPAPRRQSQIAARNCACLRFS